ncbi:hypothetical protein L0337_45780 [candidate division KSB1 bacterium]|nr:hypothetical protein [candidate division KSB1 bacterium]
MFNKTCRLLGSAVWFCASIVVLGCSETDIPNTPEAPFLFTDVEFAQSTSPQLGTTLSRGSTINFNVGIAYTLAPEDDRDRQNITVAVLFQSISATDTVDLAFSQKPVSAASGLVTESQQITLPNDAVTLSVIIALLKALPGQDPTFPDFEVESWPIQ